jgi:hypothetical protein
MCHQSDVGRSVQARAQNKNTPTNSGQPLIEDKQVPPLVDPPAGGNLILKFVVVPNSRGDIRMSYPKAGYARNPMLLPPEWVEFGSKNAAAILGRLRASRPCAYNKYCAAVGAPASSPSLPCFFESRIRGKPNSTHAGIPPKRRDTDTARKAYRFFILSAVCREPCPKRSAMRR